MYPFSLIPACTKLFLNPITMLCYAKAPKPRQNNGTLGGIGLTLNKYWSAATGQVSLPVATSIICTPK